jgi:hypothetical protein
LNSLHSVLLYMEQAVRQLSASHYKVLVSSRHDAMLTFIAATIWIFPFAVACMPGAVLPDWADFAFLGKN